MTNEPYVKFEKAMMGAERQRRHAERHAAKIARKRTRQARKATPLIEADVLALLVTEKDFERLRSA